MVTRTVLTGDDSVAGIDKNHFAFYMANDFFEKGLEATKKTHASSFNFDKQKEHWKICFPICTLAFSLELSLKLFLTTAQLEEVMKKRQGHNLLSIYNKIENDSKVAIENHFENCKAHNYGFFNITFQNNADNIILPKQGSVKELIIDALKRNGEPFIDFRYFYTSTPKKVYSFDFNTVIKLIHSCLAVKANELNIDLNSLWKKQK